MGLPLRYSIQASPLVPAGFVGDYGRMMVNYRSILDEITITASEFDLITASLSAGRAIRLVDDTGRPLGEFLTSLSGGFDIANFTQATVGDVRVSFKPTQELLISTREKTTFEQVPTVSNNPVISNCTFTFESTPGIKKVINNRLIIDTAGLLRVNGTHFVKGNMIVTVTQYKGGVTPLLSTASFISPTSTGAKYIEVLITEANLTKGGIVASGAPDIEWTKLNVALTDNLPRNSELAVKVA